MFTDLVMPLGQPFLINWMMVPTTSRLLDLVLKKKNKNEF